MGVKTLKRAALFVVAATLIQIIYGWWITGNFRAEVAARGLVELHLKSPSSAKWIEKKVIEKNRPYYLVHVVVDAQNSFGAMIRNSYCVAIKTVGWLATFYRLYDYAVQECENPPTEEEIKLMMSLNQWPKKLE